MRLGRPLILFPVMLNLFLGLFGGASRMGILSWWPPGAVASHGAVMMVGFVVSIIALEKAVTLRDPFLKAAAIVFPFGGVALVAGLVQPAYFTWVFGGVSFLLWAIKRLVASHAGYPSLFFLISGILLAFGVVFYAFSFPSTLYVFCWMGFAVAFVCGERMEMLQAKTLNVFNILLLAISFLAVGFAILFVQKTLMAFFIAAMLISAAPRDLGIRLFRRRGFGRYLSVGLLTSYFWLAFSSLVWLGEFAWDTMLHAFFLGFVGTMIYTHAPTVLPTILKSKHFYTPHLYIPFTLLQASILTRILSAELLKVDTWILSGWMTAVSVLTYLTIAFANLFLKKRF